MYLLLARMRSSCRPWWTAAVVTVGSGCGVGSGVGGASREPRANPRSVGDVGGAVAHR